MIFFKDIQLWLPVWTGSKGQIRVTFVSIYFDKQLSVQWSKNCEFTSCGCWDMIFLNIKLWFIVIRYLMTSSWRHKFVSSTCYVLSICQVSSSCDVFKYVFFCRQSIRRRRRRKKTKTRDWCLYWQTLGVREERKVKLGSILFTSLKIQTMLKLRNTLPLEYFFFSTSGLDRK